MVKKNDRTTINLSVSTEMRKWLEAEAHKHETTIAFVVRTIIRKEINKDMGGK